MNDTITTFVVTHPDIEYLPGRTMVNAPLSPTFASRDLAERALAHLRRTVPGARLSKAVTFEPDADDRANAERRRLRDRAWLAAFDAAAAAVDG